MTAIALVEVRLRKGWSRFWHSPVWSVVIASIIAAAVFGVGKAIDELLTKTPPPPAVERAEITGGAWGPSRALYWCMPRNTTCVAPGHVVFDSIPNQPFVGNTATFMAAKVLGGPGPMRNKIDVKIGDTVVLRAFVQNDAAVNIGHRRSLTARGTRFNLSLPTNSSSELPIIGHISAANAEPRAVYDAVFLRSTERFSVDYQWGSAVLSNHLHRSLPISDELMGGEGTLIGAGKPDGTFPPGLSNNAAVFLLVHIVPPTSA